MSLKTAKATRTFTQAQIFQDGHPPVTLAPVEMVIDKIEFDFIGSIAKVTVGCVESTARWQMVYSVQIADPERSMQTAITSMYNRFKEYMQENFAETVDID